MDKRTPKVVRKFIDRQMTSFITSKKFKQRVMDFLFDAVDDVVGLVYENNKKRK